MSSEHLAAANAALACFAPETSLTLERGRVVVCWTNHRGEALRRPWQARSGQDFYPVWSHKWGHGGTCCTALSQLVRWVRGLPVLPLHTWRYWCGDQVGLGKHPDGRDLGGPLLIALAAAGYPERVPCVLCGRDVERLDWWSLDGVSGPCCGWTTGCRQQGVGT